jgi:hypothetical protein
MNCSCSFNTVVVCIDAGKQIISAGMDVMATGRHIQLGGEDVAKVSENMRRSNVMEVPESMNIPPIPSAFSANADSGTCIVIDPTVMLSRLR